MSPDLALQIIAEEKLASNPEFNSALQPPSKLDRLLKALDVGDRNEESEQDRVLKAFFKRLEVYSPKESRVIGIRFTSDDPKLAAAVANRIAETYRTMLATRTLAETDDVQQALQPKIDKLVKEVAEAEAAVEHFRAQANIFKGGPNNTGLNQQQLGDITAELTQGAGRPQRSRRTRPIGARDGPGRQRRSRCPTCSARRSSRTSCSSACASSGSSPSCRRRCCRRIRACASCAPTSTVCSARSRAKSARSSKASKRAPPSPPRARRRCARASKR